VTCKTVLVVDDDDDFRDTLADALESGGFDVLRAVDGRDALDRLRGGAAATTCLILLDLMMPGMNGWQFRVEQSSDVALRDIPVIVVSADASIARCAEHFTAGEYLPKPLSLDVLLDLVRSHCG
jgi:two-component system chemotaxis response regulator CheY